MAKESGLGDRAYFNGYDLSGDIGTVQGVSSPIQTLEVTGIDKSAMERIHAKRDAMAQYTAFFNDDDTVGAEGAHEVFKSLPTTDVINAYLHGIVLGNPVFCFVAKQLNYDPTRGNDGALTEQVQAQANAYGGNWCQQYTAGKVIHASATNGSSIDNGASTDFGMTAYQQVFAVASGTMIGRMEDSDDNVSFGAITGLTFTGAAARAVQRLATAVDLTIERYTRFASTGTFTNALLFAAAERHVALGVVL